jgi:hypothetical protein
MIFSGFGLFNSLYRVMILHDTYRLALAVSSTVHVHVAGSDK